MMIAAGNVSHKLACSATNKTSATATISLSATGSRKAPNGVLCSQRRARKPSSQSVTAAIAKTALAAQ
ncbi:hypothetical protein D3C86_1967980 [compost metagenome]